jgi:2-iminobutanoate/2-iminopropanoate deaminase
MKDLVLAATAPQPIGPYSHAIKANGLVFVSGQIALNAATGTMVQDSIEAETHQVMKNMGAILEAAGVNFGAIVKTTIFLTDLGNFEKVNAIYGEYFNGTLAPARETVQVVALPKGAHVEISCIADLQN